MGWLGANTTATSGDLCLSAVNIDPAQRGLGPIGHMGYFRRESEPLWRDVLAWFGEHEPVPGAVRGSGL